MVAVILGILVNVIIGSIFASLGLTTTVTVSLLYTELGSDMTSFAVYCDVSLSVIRKPPDESVVYVVGLDEFISTIFIPESSRPPQLTAPVIVVVSLG